MQPKMIISHVRQPNKETQSNDAHQQGVANIAEAFAAEFGMGEWGRVLGLLHDKGKEKKAFQQHIIKESGLDPSVRVEDDYRHAYVGALIAQKQYPMIASLIAQPIAGHHRGLYDYCDYLEEMKREIPKEVTLDAPIPIQPRLPKMEKHDLHHFVRILFSCLVDADSLDTEAFMNTEQAKLRGSHTSMPELLMRLEKHLQEKRSNSPDTEVNRIRNYVQEQCVKASQEACGFYSLTVPTGGGKTLASILWALHHAVKNNRQRVIIAIPYTSIIVQTAATLKGIFGEDNVLEHHSNINPEDIKDEELCERIQLATENWDYPIIVTTNVQLFESLFSNKRSDCRKLHNIVKSVIILDEVQTLPLGFYKPIVHTLDTLQRVFGVSVLFTTASQPILFMEEANTYDEIAKELAKHQRVLCIVNTRRDAKELYDRLPKEGVCLHLSRMMCPAHVSDTIGHIKEALKNQDNSPIRVIATQLIEAGVDIDFPVVFRQEAGLDSILQAAGRCNREGKQRLCTTYVFSLGKEHPLPPGFISQTNNARLGIGKQHDWFAPETMNSYFRQLHCRIDSFDSVTVKGVKYSMQELLYKIDVEFEKAAEVFHLIDDQTRTVIVNWNGSLTYYHQLISQGASYSLMKKLSQYSVNIRERDFRMLQDIGAIEEPLENIYAITNPGFYKADTGLTMENQWLEETFII